MSEVLNKEFDWMVENEDETITVKAKGIDYIFEEVTEEIVERCQKLSEKTGTPIQTLLAVKSIQSPKVTDMDFKQLKASVTSKLKFAAAKINGLTDFL